MVRLDDWIYGKTCTFNDAKEEFKEYEIIYKAPEMMYVMIYNAAAPAASSNKHRAPGRKETATIEIKGVSVNAYAVDEYPGSTVISQNFEERGHQCCAQGWAYCH